MTTRRAVMNWIAIVFMTAVSSGGAEPAQSPGEGERREWTKAEVEALIEKAGRTRPDWWESVPLDYPKTLDLNWPKPPPGWNTAKHIGHYMFSVINENPSRWKMGTKFMHHVLAINDDNPVRWTAMAELGHCYHDLLRDWARAAYWWGQSGTSNMNYLVSLAHCYYKLGSKEMAADQLRAIRVDYTRYGSAIKLWSDMGEFETAIELAEASAGESRWGGAYMGAGDACRKHRRFQEAIIYYQKVLAIPMKDKDQLLKRNHDRARIAIETIATVEALDLGRIPDGTYAGSSLSYNGDLTVSVTVAEGKIVSVRVTRHRDKQHFSALTDTPEQIVKKQGLQDVDATTGATITSDAVVSAAAKALASGMQ